MLISDTTALSIVGSAARHAPVLESQDEAFGKWLIAYRKDNEHLTHRMFVFPSDLVDWAREVGGDAAAGAVEDEIRVHSTRTVQVGAPLSEYTPQQRHEFGGHRAVVDGYEESFRISGFYKGVDVVSLFSQTSGEHLGFPLYSVRPIFEREDAV